MGEPLAHLATPLFKSSLELPGFTHFSIGLTGCCWRNMKVSVGALTFCVVVVSAVLGARCQGVNLLALVSHNGSAAIISTAGGGEGMERGGEEGGEEGGRGEDQLIPFPGYQVSEACLSNLRSRRCRILYKEKLSDGSVVLGVPLQRAVGFMKLKFVGTNLVQFGTMVLPIPNEGCIPLDIARSTGPGERLVVFCLKRTDPRLQELVSCDIQLDQRNISQSTLHVCTTKIVRYYPARNPLDYFDISNFVYLPEYTQFAFSIGGDNAGTTMRDIIGFNLNRHGAVQHYTANYQYPGCDHLIYAGNDLLYAYCQSGQMLMFDLDTTGRPTTLHDGVRFGCPGFGVITFQRTMENVTAINGAHIVGIRNLTYANCHGKGKFIVADRNEGIEEFDISNRSVRSIPDSSNFSQVFPLERLLVGQRIEPSFEVVVYDESIEPILKWPGSALAVAVLLQPTSVSSSSTAPPMEIPSTSFGSTSAVYITTPLQSTARHVPTMTPTMLVSQPQPITTVTPQLQSTAMISPQTSLTQPTSVQELSTAKPQPSTLGFEMTTPSFHFQSSIVPQSTNSVSPEMANQPSSTQKKVIIGVTVGLLLAILTALVAGFTATCICYKCGMCRKLVAAGNNTIKITSSITSSSDQLCDCSKLQHGKNICKGRDPEERQESTSFFNPIHDEETSPEESNKSEESKTSGESASAAADASNPSQGSATMFPAAITEASVLPRLDCAATTPASSSIPTTETTDLPSTTPGEVAEGEQLPHSTDPPAPEWSVEENRPLSLSQPLQFVWSNPQASAIAGDLLQPRCSSSPPCSPSSRPPVAASAGESGSRGHLVAHSLPIQPTSLDPQQVTETHENRVRGEEGRNDMEEKMDKIMSCHDNI